MYQNGTTVMTDIPHELIEAAFVAGPDKPASVCVQTLDGVTWFAIRDYGNRQEGLQNGTGCFFVFQSKNATGAWGDWVILNGGLISREPGNEQGDIDLLVTVDGKVGGFAITGNMTKFGGPAAGLLPINNEQMNIGSPSQRINRVFAKSLAIETVGKQIFIDGTWKWRDCIPVETQQGVRWLPVYEDSDKLLLGDG